MKKKFAEAWRKLAPQQRQHIQAVLLVIVLHAFLLLLFQAQTPQAHSQQGEMPRIKQLDLSREENRQLAEWLAIHDPARTTMPDRRHGYSMQMSNIQPHPQPEDILHLPQLSLPQMPRQPQLQLNRTTHRNLQIAGTDWQIVRQTSAPVEDLAVQVWVNGSRQPQLEAFLKQELPAVEKEITVEMLLMPSGAAENAPVNLMLKNSISSSALEQQTVTAVKNFLRQDRRNVLHKNDLITVIIPAAKPIRR